MTFATERGTAAQPGPAWPQGAQTEAASFATPGDWLGHLVRLDPGIQEAVLVLGEAPNIGPFHPMAQHPSPGPAGDDRPSDVLAGACERALDLRVAVTTRNGPAVVLALPILTDGDVFGVVGFVTQTPGAPARLQDAVTWGKGWLLVRGAHREAAARDDLRERLLLLLDLVMGVFDEADPKGALQAVATEAAVRLGCDRVSVGFGRNGHVRVAALSHAADFQRRQDLTRAIEAAMEEAADQGREILVEGERLLRDDGRFLAIREHQRLSREFGSAAVLSVPFAADERRSGVFVFEWATAPVPAQATKEAGLLAPVLGRILLERIHADRGIPARIVDGTAAFARRLVGPRHTLAKLLAVALIAAVGTLSVVTGEHRVSADAGLEGGVRRILAAPFDGFIAAAAARAGDRVPAGTVLAQLDDRELRLDFQRWTSQAEQFLGQANAAEAQGDLGQLRIAQAQVRQAEAQRALAWSQMERARITAPFDGLVVSGDLSQQLGGAVRKGQSLFEVTPLDSYRVVLKVEEADIGWVHEGQRGELVATALTDVRFPFTVSLVTPVATATGGRNVFRVEATLDVPPEALATANLRPGMEGVAKVSIGERLLVWVWTHRFLRWARLQAWTWLGV